jgi:hypothetical protein
MAKPVPTRIPRHIWAGALVAVVVGAVLALVVQQQIASPVRYNRATAALTLEELLGQLPWLKTGLEQWQQRASAAAHLPSYAEVGAYPVGNGRVFGIVGLGWPFGALSNLIGPSYQKQVGFLGAVVPWLLAGGKEIPLLDQTVTWCAQAPVVRVSERSDQGLGLELYYGAVPEQPAIVFAVAVVNWGRALARRVRLALTASDPGAEAVEEGMVVTRGPLRLRVGLVGARGVLAPQLWPTPPPALPKRLALLQPGSGSTVTYEFGTLAPGQSVVKLGYLLFSTNTSAEQAAWAALRKSGFEALEACHAAWQRWWKPLVKITTGDQRLDEWFQAQQYIIAAQQSLCGAFSPMHGYTYAWVRDSNGPVRFFSALGATAAVRDHLEYHFRACAKLKAIGNNVPLDLPLPQAVGPVDWGQLPVEPAEVPSFVVLQHWWYYRVTGDTALLKLHWGLLERCLRGQQFDAAHTLPFHGDETYRFPGYELFNAGEPVEDWVCLETRSADSAFEYCAAREAYARMYAAVFGAQPPLPADPVRAHTERLFWQADKGFYAPARSDFADQQHRYPFADINLHPLWLGYGRPEEPRQQQNVLVALRYLWRGQGLVKMTPGQAYTVGMTPGYVLWNLAALRHPEARRALQALLACAEPSGGYAEMLDADGRPAERVWGQHRARPWEGGINAEAVLQALTGYEPDAAHRRARLRPLLLAGPQLHVTGLPLGPVQLDLTVRGEGGRCYYRLEVRGAGLAQATVDLDVVVWGSSLAVQRIAAANASGVHPVPGPKWPWAEELRIPGLVVTADEPAEVSISYTPAAHLATLPAAVPFDYGPAQVPPGTQAIVVTPAGEQARRAAQRLGGRVYALDTKIPWPASYLRSALFAGQQPRVPLVILDVDKYPGAFKRRTFWTTGAGGQVLRAYQQAGGKVERVAQPSPPPAPAGGQVALGG